MDRREMIRRSGFMTVAALMADPTFAEASAYALQADGTPESQPPIALDLLGGDVWAWDKQITGTCPGVPDDATIAIINNGESIPAKRLGEQFGANVSLSPGPNEIVAVATLADGSEVRSEPATHTVRLSPRPTSRIVITVEDGSIRVDGTTSETSEFDGAAITSYAWTTRDDNPEKLRLFDPSESDAARPDTGSGATPVSAGGNDGASIVYVAPATDGEYYVSLQVIDEAGREDISTAYFVVEEGSARAADPVSEVASWVESAVVYGMVVRNFTREGFRGVTERLDELQELGVTAIWFAPITRTVGNLFGYEVTDYFNVRPEYGTLDDFKVLVDESHRRDIKVLMDFVPNHTSERHSYFVDAEDHGEASQYYDYFDRDENGNYTYYFEWMHLPNLNFENPEVRRFMTEAFAFWVREYGVDGFRADVAWGIKERRPDYWLEWSAELNRIKPDSLLVAEASARDPFYFHNGFDAAYDWTDELGVWAWDDAFAFGFPMSMGMGDALTNNGEGYDPDALIFRFLNNNDTGSRFVSIYGVDFYRTAMAMMMTLPGIPCVYTGDEVGAQFLPYETLGEIDWDDPNNLRPYIEKLISLRRDHPALYSRNWVQIDAEPSTPIFAYLRQTTDAEESIVVVLNFSQDEVDANVPLPQGFLDSAGAGGMFDFWFNEEIQRPDSDALAISVPPWSFRLLVERPS